MKEPLNETTYASLADLFKVFGDTTRIRILAALMDEKNPELCVNDLAARLDMTQSAISHQLTILKHTKLVKARRNGKMICYSLDDEHVRAILACGLEHVEEE